jgi:hypothetical protein
MWGPQQLIKDMTAIPKFNLCMSNLKVALPLASIENAGMALPEVEREACSFAEYAQWHPEFVSAEETS